MKRRDFLLAMGAVAALPGCTTALYSTRGDIEPRLVARVRGSIGPELDEVNKLLGTPHYQNVLNEYLQAKGMTPYGRFDVPTMTAKVTGNSRVVNAQFDMHSTDKLKYNPGEYLLDPDTGNLDPLTTVFIDGVRRAIKRLHRQILNNGKEYDLRLEAEYIGGADGGRILSPIPLSKALGDIDEMVYINDKGRRRVMVKKGGFITTNAQLALVRAVAVSRAVDIKIAPVRLDSSYKIELSDHFGNEYRFVRVNLRITKRY